MPVHGSITGPQRDFSNLPTEHVELVVYPYHRSLCYWMFAYVSCVLLLTSESNI